MKKLSLLLILYWISCLPIFGQAVTTDPLLPNGDQEITLIFDLTQAKDSRAKALLGKTSDVYLWSGAGTSATGDAFEYQPAGQTNFNVAYEKGKMTSLGNNKWSIKMIPRTYFAVPTGKAIRKLGVLLKSGDGTAQTEDFIVTMYDSFAVSFVTPAASSVVLQQGQDLPISIKTTKKAILTAEVSIDGKVQSQGTTLFGLPSDSTDSFSKTLSYKDLEQIIATNGTSSTIITMKVQAQAKAGVSSAQITVMLPPKYVVETVPTAWKDGINYLSETSVGLVLYAPLKSFVYVIGDFNNWQTNSNYLMKRSPDGNRYWLEIDNLTKAQEYAYQYFIDGTLAVADPYAEKILDPNNDQYIPTTTYPNLKTLPALVKTIASVLQTAQTPYVWKNTSFKRPAKEDLVVYELHVRDFVADKNYKAVMDTLSYLKNLGVNAIELMPVQEFTGNDSWGYNPTFYFATDKAYGTKNDFKTLVDKCHEMGFAVILDVVFNQADYEFPYVKMYWDGSQPAANSPFFNQQATHPFSVFFDFNHESPATRTYISNAVQFWLKEYNIDGYRIDLAKGFTQKQSSNDAIFRLYDQSRVDNLKYYYDSAKQIDASAYFILELFSEDAEERAFINYGMMVWANHNYDFRNLTKGYNADLSRLSYKNRGMASPGLVSYMESHDEERVIYDVLQNGKVSNTYTTKDLATALERIKTNAALFFTVPGPKMLWQFGELGYDISIDQNGRTGQKPLKWDYYKDSRRLNVYKAYAALIKLKTTQSIFKTTDFDIDLSGFQKKVTLRSADNTVLVVGNFDVEKAGMSRLFPSTGKWYDFFTGSTIDVTDLDLPLFLEPGEFHVFSLKAFPKPETGIVPWKVPSSLVITGTETETQGMARAYPNPSRSNVTIELPSWAGVGTQLTIYDFYGKIVYQSTVKDTKVELNINAYKEGIYGALLQWQDKSAVIKFVKIP